MGKTTKTCRYFGSHEPPKLPKENRREISTYPGMGLGYSVHFKEVEDLAKEAATQVVPFTEAWLDRRKQSTGRAQQGTKQNP